MIAGLVTGIVALALYLASLLPAHAGIETLLVTSVTSLLTAVGVSAAVASAVAPILTSALVIGATLAVSALTRGGAPEIGGSNTVQVDPGRARDTFESSESPELRAVGRVRLGGLKAFGDTSGSHRYRMTLHCKGEIDGFEQFLFGGREVISNVDGDGEVSSFPWAYPGGSYAYLWAKAGTDGETSWAPLLADFPTVWTSDHRARGIAQSLANFINPGFDDPKFLQFYQGGVPETEVIVRAERAYDPRTTTTYWTENGIVNALHVLTSIYRGITTADIDGVFIGGQADAADANIATKTGTIKRAKCAGVWSSETARGASMQKVLDSIGAWIVPRDGGYKLGLQLIDDDPAAEVTIPVKHIVDLQWQSGPAGVERPNICRVKYYSPERNYELTEIDMSGIAWARIDDEVTASGEKYFDVELSFCPVSGQAQRRARQMFALARADSGIIKANMAGLAVWGCKIVNFEFPDDLGTIKCLIAPPRALDDQGLVEIPFVVWPTLAAWNPSTDEANAPEQLLDEAFGSPIAAPSTPSAAIVVTYGNGDKVTRVAYTIPAVVWTGAEAVFRGYSNGNPLIWRALTEYEANGYTHAHTSGDYTGQKLDFRVRINDDSGNSSRWSGTFAVESIGVDNSAPDVPTLNGSMVDTTLFASGHAPLNLQVAYLNGISPASDRIRPGENFAWTKTVSGVNDDLTTVTAHASDGTSSAVASLRASHDTDTGGTIAAAATQGSGRIDVFWRSNEADPSVVTQRFTGPGAPAPQAPGNGTWTVTGLTAGTYTITTQGYDATEAPIGSPASINITL